MNHHRLHHYCLNLTSHVSIDCWPLLFFFFWTSCTLAGCSLIRTPDLVWRKTPFMDSWKSWSRRGPYCACTKAKKQSNDILKLNYFLLLRLLFITEIVLIPRIAFRRASNRLGMSKIHLHTHVIVLHELEFFLLCQTVFFLSIEFSFQFGILFVWNKTWCFRIVCFFDIHLIFI